MAQKTGINSGDAPIGGVIAIWILRKEKLGLFYLVPAVWGIPAGFIATFLCLPGWPIERFKHLIWLLKFSVASLSVLFHVPGEGFMCAGPAEIDEETGLVAERVACTAKAFFHTSIDTGVTHYFLAAGIGVLVAIVVYLGVSLQMKKDFVAAKKRMEEFNHIRGSQILTPAQVMANTKIEKRED